MDVGSGGWWGGCCCASQAGGRVSGWLVVVACVSPCLLLIIHLVALHLIMTHRHRCLPLLSLSPGPCPLTHHTAGPSHGHIRHWLPRSVPPSPYIHHSFCSHLPADNLFRRLVHTAAAVYSRRRRQIDLIEGRVGVWIIGYLIHTTCSVAKAGSDVGT